MRGGVQNVYGTASGTVVSAGYQVVAAGGTASNTVVSSGGNQFISGTAFNTVVSSGGDALVTAVGHVSGATLSGGELEIMNGGTAGATTITFAGGGELKLDNAPAFGGKISGFGVPGEIDLVNVNFGAATLGYSGNTLSGTLTVGDGVHIATLAMLGNYAAGNFHLANDGAGGTMVTDPPISSGQSVAAPGP